MRRLLALAVLSACDTTVVDVEKPRRTLESSWIDFPADRDLAILLPLERDPLFPADTVLSDGATLLPEGWLTAVSNAYQQTDVGDALEEESLFEDWRLVSMRVSPCAPIARSPAQASADLCWPIVRLVWQPVVNHMNLGGVQLDAYADDRAIHALYPLVPRNEQGARYDSAAYRTVLEHIEAGDAEVMIPTSVRSGFDAARDSTTAWLLGQLEALRDPTLPVGSWDGIDTRPELNGGPQDSARFQDALQGFLSEFASPPDIRELTSFSLPAGRNPSGDDLWVFVQFLSDGTTLRQNELELFSRTDGRRLLRYGTDQGVGMVNESEAVSAALDADPNGELHDTVVESTADIDQVADLVADPEAVFVPNTTCATCHRLNDIRFDFHSLSHLEDREHTVSPRVVEDVARDQRWVDGWLQQVGPAVTDVVDTTSSTDTAEQDASPEDLEPNDTMDSAILAALPFAVSGTITAQDMDVYQVTTTADVLSVTLRFDHAQGDLDLALYDAAGGLVDSSESTEDEERIDVFVGGGTHFVVVYGYQDATGAYTLSAAQ